KEEIADKYVKEYKNGEAYNVESPKVEGYVTTTKTVSGTMGLDDVSVEVTYKVDADNDGVADVEETNTLTITYVNEAKEEIADKYVKEYKNGEEYNVESPKVEGYVTTTTAVTGTMGLDDVSVEVTYKVDADNDGVADAEETNTLTITYVNEAKEEVATTYTHEYKNGEAYNVESPKVDGYVTT